MNDNSVFNYYDYKAYLTALTGVGQRRGLRLQMAKAAKCQPTYVSLVLNGNSHFSLEQAELISDFLGHSKEEMHFFLLLLQKGRAGSKRLENYFREQAENIKKQRMVFTQRFGKEHVLSEVQQAKYYSSWIYGAIHIALSIPQLQNKKSLSKFLQVPQTKVSEVIEFLLQSGLIVEQNGKYIFGPTQVRLGNDSPNIIKHHANWRTRAIESLERETLNDLHYSGVYSVSKKDVIKIKDQLLEHIKACQQVLRASAEEELYCFGVDFFNLKVDISEQ